MVITRKLDALAVETSRKRKCGALVLHHSNEQEFAYRRTRINVGSQSCGTET